MSQQDLKKVEELQITLMKNPRSPAFASLSEAYRKMGLLEEALEVTTKGIRHNPDYVSGLVAHAKILYEMKDYSQALIFLKKVHQLKPENILALRLLGHSLAKMRKHPEALQAFKKLLIFDPKDEKVQFFIRKWQFLENIPSPFENSDFAVENYDHWIQSLPSDEQVCHIIDSFMNFNDYENALEIANLACDHWPNSDTLKHRKRILMNSSVTKMEQNRENQKTLSELEEKRSFYEKWLRRIETWKRIDPR